MGIHLLLGGSRALLQIVQAERMGLGIEAGCFKYQALLLSATLSAACCFFSLPRWDITGGQDRYRAFGLTWPVMCCRGETVAVCTMEKANMAINKLAQEGRLGAAGGLLGTCRTAMRGILLQ